MFLSISSKDINSGIRARFQRWADDRCSNGCSVDRAKKGSRAGRDDREFEI
ncbi:hypothetical protein Scep_025952 [Stephania cephalantha]|uniref:Uncharacterized protein n=1 Tax=Stephania cephalantha TaxID=152367 RepID=A0AAP0HMS0_9MAGN